MIEVLVNTCLSELHFVVDFMIICVPCGASGYFWACCHGVVFVNIEVRQLRTHLSEFSVHQYEPTLNVISKYKDGGVAIVDQWICTHAR